MSSRDRSRPDLPALTGLRFLAAIYVVIYHFAPPDWNGSALGRQFIENGRISVEFFFILSGFILTYVHDQPLATGSERREFWFSRFARIYPVYLLALALSAPFWWQQMLAWHGPGSRTALYSGVTWVICAFLLQAWMPRFARDCNPAAWSLSAEAFFYACFPFLVQRIRRFTIRQAMLLASGAWLCITLPRAIYYSLPLHLQVQDAISGIPEYNPLLRLAEFIGGIAVAQLLMGSRQLPTRVADRLALAAVAALVLSTILLHKLLLAMVFFPEVAVLIFCLAQANGILSRLLGCSLMKLLGEASYSMYILQFPLYWMLVKQPNHGAGSSNSELAFLIFLLTLIVASIATFKLIERPAMKQLRKRFRHRNLVIPNSLRWGGDASKRIRP